MAERRRDGREDESHALNGLLISEWRRPWIFFMKAGKNNDDEKVFLTLLIPFLLALSAIQFGNPRPALAASPFVVTSGTSFILNGKDFYFAGTNNYYFHYKSKKWSTMCLKI